MKKKTTCNSAGAAPNVLRIEGEMTIYRAAELKEAIVAILEDHSEIEIDLSRVTEIDSAGIQLLLLAKRSTDESQRLLRLTGHSSAVVDAMELLNLIGYFGDPVVFTSES